MNQKIYLSEDWLFNENFQEGMTATEYPEETLQPVRIPHTCKETPFHYFDESLYQMVSGYRRHLHIPTEWQGKRILLTFEGAGHDSTVYLNGSKVGEHHCGYTAFTVDLSAYANYGQDNVLCVRLDSREDLNVPPFGYVIDYMTYGGIYRDVYLEVKDQIALEDIFVHTLITPDEAQVTSEITFYEVAKDLNVRQYYMLKSDAVMSGVVSDVTSDNDWQFLCEQNVPTGTTAETPFRIQGTIPHPFLWDTEHPHLYLLKTQLWQGEQLLDEAEVTFGIRDAVFKKDGFYLNGKKLRIRGLNRHQSYPYVGYAMPESMQKLDADLLKKELGLNAVRTSHYPQSHYFLERCDELGLLVFTEFPGWQHIGDDTWKAQAVVNAEDMIRQYRNHPSIILWGVRINESPDDDPFYEKTNAVAHKLDPMRPTGGVRAIKKSHLLEDVYTYNDFLHDGETPGCDPKKKVTSDTDKPYLISEYNGHMYPTKAFDNEERRSEHAIRHANVLDAVAEQEDIAGSFGWCMFDYQTHKDFGSGDRICYHGVLDSFRNPKLAAAVYASQGDADPVLAVSSSMDIGDNPAGQLGTAYVFSNAQQVKLYKNDVFVTALRQSEWTALPHPPFVVDDTIGELLETQEHFSPSKAAAVRDCLLAAGKYGLAGLPLAYKVKFGWCMLHYKMTFEDGVALYGKYVGNWGGEATRWRFDAVQDGNVVRSVTLCPSAKLHLEVKASRTALREQDTYDMAAVRVRILDENGIPAPYAQFPVQFAVEGSAALVGPQTAVAEGGMTGTYLRTVGTAGESVLTVSAPQTQPVVLRFTIEKEDAVWN